MARVDSGGCWLIKSEPYKYAWSELVSDRSTYWDGVRNYEARNNLRSMRVGDLCFFYHSNEGKEIVGIARVSRESYPDPTTDDERWVVVDVEPVVALVEPVSLAAIKAEARLAEMALVRRSRLSVVPVEAEEFRHVLAMAKTKLPAEFGPPKSARGLSPPGGGRRKTARKKTARKKTAPKKTAPKKTAPKKTARKKTASKKRPAKKAVKKSPASG